MSKPKRSGYSLADLASDGALDNDAKENRQAKAPEAAIPADILPAPRKAPPKAINVYISAADHKRLSMLSVSLETKLQQLGHEAWNLLLRKHGLEELEPTKAPSAAGRKRE